jgi:hypothetical protein
MMVDNSERVARILAALERFGLKLSGKKGRCNSPLRPGSNSLAFSIDIDDAWGGGGKWYDFVSHDHGNFIELERLLPGLLTLAEHTPVTALAKPTNPDTIADYAGLHDYAQAQGAPVEVFRAAGWRKGVFYCYQQKRERLALVFDTPTGTRARFIDGQRPKYMSPAGYQRSWYRLPEALHLAETTGQPLVICNGEASVIVAQYFGVAATAVTGGGENGIPAALLAELREAYQGPVIIALDCDPTGRDGSAKMLATLRSADYSVRAVDLNGGAGFDLANFTKLHQLETPAALVALDDLPEPQPAAPSSPEAAALLAQKDEIIAQQQRVIGQLRAELAMVQERNRYFTAVLQRKELTKGERTALYAVRLAYESVPLEDRPVSGEDDQKLRVCRSQLGSWVGESASTIGRNLQKLEERGLIGREVDTVYDPAAGQYRKELKIWPKQDIDAIATLPLEEKTQGGKREKGVCASCGSDDLVDVTHTFCNHCRQLQGGPRYRSVKTGQPIEAVVADPEMQFALSLPDAINPASDTEPVVEELSAEEPADGDNEPHDAAINIPIPSVQSDLLSGKLHYGGELAPTAPPTDNPNPEIIGPALPRPDSTAVKVLTDWLDKGDPESLASAERLIDANNHRFDFAPELGRLRDFVLKSLP